MNIYAAHKFEDHGIIDAYGKKLKEQVFDSAFCQLTASSKFWKRKTRGIMKKTDIVVYFVGNYFSKNIHWELLQAQKYGIPIYLVKLSDDIDLQHSKYSALYDANNYDGEIRLKYRIITFEELLTLASARNDALQKKLFVKSEEKIEEKQSLVFDQYKLLLSTSESLVERRQKISNIYIGVCAILVPIITAFISTSNIIMIACAPLICLLVILLCTTWIKTITDYGKLNAAKFKIIEEIEQRLPLCVFGSEWIVLSHRTKRYVSFTHREKFLPRVFLYLACVLMLASITILIVRTVMLVS